MVKLTAIIVSLAVALSAGTATASAKSTRVTPADFAATHAYLFALYQFRQAAKGDGRADQAGVRALVEQVSSQCPNVLTGMPATKALLEISQEIFLEVAQTFVQPQRNATIAFAKKVRRLRWSNRKLTYYIRGSAAEARANAELVAPEICSDARALAASGFQAVSASTTRFLQQVNAANSKVDITSPGESGNLEEDIMRMLKPYERPDEQTLIPRPLTKREREVAEPLAVKLISSPASEISYTLGLRETAGRVRADQLQTPQCPTAQRQVGGTMPALRGPQRRTHSRATASVRSPMPPGQQPPNIADTSRSVSESVLLETDSMYATIPGSGRSGRAGPIPPVSTRRHRGISCQPGPGASPPLTARRR
jgi:hypothetical protein